MGTAGRVTAKAGLLIVAMMFGVSPTMAAPESPAEQASPAEPDALIAEPRTNVELVRNIQYIMRHGLFGDRDFYLQDNLKKVFGATTVTADHFDGQTSAIRYVIHDSMRWQCKMPWADKCFGGHIDIRRKADGEEFVVASFIPMQDKTLDYPAVKKLFAVGWIEKRPPMRHWGHNQVIPAPTNRYGYEALVFVPENVNGESSIMIMFDKDGFAERLLPKVGVKTY